MKERTRANGLRAAGWRGLVWTAALGLLVSPALLARQGAAKGEEPPAPTPPGPTLEETRLAMGKWIETQQILSKERKDWQQGKEILLARLEVIRQEVSSLEGKIAQAQTSVAEGQRKKDDLRAENERLKAVGAQLAEALSAMEGELRPLFRSLPEPVRAKLQPLVQRIPEDPANTRVSAAERFQNVLGILNELNKANNEIAVLYEVRNLSGGAPSEVQAIYVGLAQAYYLGARGESGIGRPTPEGWQWEASRSLAESLRTVLEILQGKHSPAFVPLPVTLR
ncbi:MAG: DUF3450 domain-containing protein [Planctomycetes bacterium]|nr:DUF3450 domain-containing protein [Planctomycetota bacterium]